MSNKSSEDAPPSEASRSTPPVDAQPKSLSERSAGLLLHLTSLPGEYGIGNLGAPARALVDFLADAGITHWQICPVGPTGFGDSPYQVFSTHAGNPYLLDWAPIRDAGLLAQEELRPLNELPPDQVDYGALHHAHRPIAQLAAQRFTQNPNQLEHLYGPYETFLSENAHWLEPYALYQTLKKRHQDQPWWLWPPEFRSFEQTTRHPEQTRPTQETHLQRFLQYLFFGQWNRLRTHAKLRNVNIIGDLPIYVAPDSADVWQRPDLFQLDITRGFPFPQAGVPPDYFNPDGQLWGNPLYDWPVHQNENYAWWLNRLDAQTRLFDLTRIDHFRGLHDYWSVPAGNPEARQGHWEPGPGPAFLQALRARFPTLPFLAEDLGLLSQAARDLRRASGLPGMAVLQFAFDGDPANLYLPHNLPPDLVLYTGTHDNDTTQGWYQAASEEVRGNFRSYLNVSGHDAPWDLLRAAYRSTSPLCITPAQDLLSLPSSARLNRPGHPTGNWTWRLLPDQLAHLREQSAPYLKEQAKLTNRLPNSTRLQQPRA